ncbi:MAG: hypothetical protein M0Z80_11025 [Treponema sp.]|nr:hypothetical protein [Treponema sp.]
MDELEPIAEDRRDDLGFLSASARAFELASDLVEDIPLIPESSGLELADEADITDIIGFIDIDDSARLEDLDTIEEDFGAEGDSDSRLPRSLQPEFILDDAELPSDGAELEQVEEEEFPLLLSSIDLSSLEQWESGPAGAAEADATRSDFEAGPQSPKSSRSGETVESQPSEEEEPRTWRVQRSAPIDTVGESDDSVLVGDEIPMLSENMRELVELLPASENDDADPLELTEYLGPALRYCPACKYEVVAQAASEELPVVGEGDPWFEAEYLGEFDSEAADEDEVFESDSFRSEGPILYQGGIFRINPGFKVSDAPKLDPELRDLVDSVLGGD